MEEDWRDQVESHPAIGGQKEKPITPPSFVPKKNRVQVSAIESAKEAEATEAHMKAVVERRKAFMQISIDTGKLDSRRRLRQA